MPYKYICLFSMKNGWQWYHSSANMMWLVVFRVKLTQAFAQLCLSISIHLAHLNVELPGRHFSISYSRYWSYLVFGNLSLHAGVISSASGWRAQICLEPYFWLSSVRCTASATDLSVAQTKAEALLSHCCLRDKNVNILSSYPP